MKRVVVTGATSMIGIALIKECIKSNVEVLAIVRRQSINLNRLPDSDMIEICECNLNELNTIPVNRQYDVFYHLAWAHTAKAKRDDPVLQEKNIKYSLDAVELAHKLGCKKFIGAGSQAEYGRVDHVITPETAVAPLIAYGMAKYAAGRLCVKLCRQYAMICIWGRIFSVYGRYDNEETMLSYAIDRFQKGETAKFSSAMQMWDYLHEDDAGRIFYLLGQAVQKERVYCIASGNSRKLKEYILEVKDIFGEDARCEFADAVEESSRIGLEVDTEDLVKDIGYIPRVSFREGILDMVKYRKKDIK